MKKLLHQFILPLLAGAIAASGVATLFSVHADQSERIPPTAGIYTGIQFSGKLGDAFRSVSTANKGNSAPANVGGTTVDGLEWLDDTTSTWIKKRYVNGGWATEAAYLASDSSYIGVIGGGAPVTIASATTTDLGSVPQANITISGTTPITGFGSAAPSGVVKFIRFSGALILTYSSALTVPGGYNLNTAANDRAIVTHLGSGNWEVTQYTRASGIPVDLSAVGEAKMTFQADAPDSLLFLPGDGRSVPRTSVPAYFAKVTRAQNGTRTSGNATIASVANTEGFGVGMPVESTGVNAGCTIASFVVNTSVTLNSAGCVTASGTSTLRVFPTGYGTAGDATTVGLPDCRGRAIVGIDPTGTILTTAEFGYTSGKNPNALNQPGGREFHVLTVAQLASHTHAVSGNTSTESATHTHNYLTGTAGAQKPNGTGTTPFDSTATGATTGTENQTHTHSFNVTSGSTGSDNGHPTVTPSVTAHCYVRILP